VTLGCKVVDFGGPDLLNDTNQVGRVGHIAIMQPQLDLRLVRILVQVVDTAGIEGRSSPLDTVDLVSLCKQELCQVRAILACNAG
jgi:hypothetical protein